MNKGINGATAARQVDAINPFTTTSMRELMEKWAKRGPEPWWMCSDANRSGDMAWLRIFTDQEELHINDVRKEPEAYNQLLREWRVCQECIKDPAPPSCPQAKNGLKHAYLVLRTWFQAQADDSPPIERHEFRMRPCPGREARREEFASLGRATQRRRQTIPGDYVPDPDSATQATNQTRGDA